MRKIIGLVLIVLFSAFVFVYAQKEQTEQTVSFVRLNDSILLRQEKCIDVIVNTRNKSKKESYKLNLPKIINLDIKKLSSENDVFVRVKVVTINEAYKYAPELLDSLKKGDVILRFEQYTPIVTDTIRP